MFFVVVRNALLQPHIKQIWTYTHLRFFINLWHFRHFNFSISHNRQTQKPFFYCSTNSNIISLYGLKYELLTTSMQLENITLLPNHCRE